MKTNPIIAAIQMCSSSNLDENLKTAGRLITEAAKHHANLVVLPEMFAMIGKSEKDKVSIKEKFGDGKIQHFLSQQAKENQIWIVGGTIPIACDDPNKVRAASLVFDDKGRCVARYDKIHLFDVTLSNSEKYQESDTTEPGDKVIVVDTPFAKLGLSVCYDIRFTELFRLLSEKGAEILIVPAAFTVPTGEAHWELLMRARAVENFSYVVGACQGGTHSNGRKTYGHSMIVEPWGTIAAKQNSMESGVIYSTIQLDSVYQARKSIPLKRKL